MTGPLLAVSGVTKRFGDVVAVDDLSLQVQRGEIFALLGPNGAGKTTLVRMANRIIEPDAGAITYGFPGDEARSPAPGRLGYLPEDRGLYRDVPLLRTLVFFGGLRGMARGAAESEARLWLERFELADRADHKLETLSKGNQQKVQFIAAVLHRPELAFLDEPFSGLDPLNQALFLELLGELRAGGTTIVLSAHQMDLVEQIADRVLILGNGRQVLAGTLPEIRAAAGAGRRRLRFRVDGAVDTDELSSLAAVLSVQATDGELRLELREEAELGELLVAVGRRARVLEVESERVSLHQVYVERLGRPVDGASP